jgi:hypothetical protein
VYARYLETCKHLGINPVPRDRAQSLTAKWSDAIAAGQNLTLDGVSATY